MTQKQSARTILATKLKEYRNRAGLTIFEVGERIGKSGKTVSAWENGHGQPDAEMFVKLFHLYGMKSMSDFYDVTDKDDSADEKELIEAYRSLNSAGKAMILANAKALAKSGDYTETAKE